jgi:hypothetical protein
MALYAAKTAGRNRVVCADEKLAVANYDGANRPVRSAERPHEASPPGAASAVEDRQSLRPLAG